MARLDWITLDYKNDLDQIVVYPRVGPAEPWDGLVSISEKPFLIREIVKHREGHIFIDRRAERNFSLSISCFACPEVILKPKTVFDFTYRVYTSKGSDIHLVYNARALMTDSILDEDDSIPFDLDIITTPMSMPGGLKPSAHLIIDAVDSPPGALFALESILYGAPNVEPRFPHPEEVFSLFSVKL